MKNVKALMIFIMAVMIINAYPNKANSEDKASDLSNRANSYYKSGNYKQAFELYTKDAEQRVPDAQNNLASMYEEGLGVEKNYIQINKFWRAN